MEDAAYDRLCRELLELEEQYPDLVRPDSPSQRLGAFPSDGFSSVVHRISMLSLDNAFSDVEIEHWHRRLVRELDLEEGTYLPMMCELKIDGNALALTYENACWCEQPPAVMAAGAKRSPGKQ